MIKMIILALVGGTGLVIGADQLAPATGQDIVSSLQWDKVVGTGGSIFLLFMSLRYVLNKNEEQSEKIDQLHAEKEAILKEDRVEMLKVLVEVRDALKELGRRHAD